MRNRPRLIPFLALILTRPPGEGENPGLPTCPDGERIFRQHEENPEIPLCPSIDAGHRCHKEGGPDKCPLWDRPTDGGGEEPEPAPMMGPNTTKPKTEETDPPAPPRRTRKKRGES